VFRIVCICHRAPLCPNWFSMHICLFVFMTGARHARITAAIHQFSTLTAENCGFKSIHSHNIGRLCDQKKDWEGHRSRPPMKIKFLGLASLAEDQRDKKIVAKWVSDTRIKPKHLYSLSIINSHSKPGREGYNCDWNFKLTFLFNPPIWLPRGVGRGVHFPCDSHSAHLMHPFKVAQRRIHDSMGCTLVEHT
jgi:hypothetical protein